MESKEINLIYDVVGLPYEISVQEFFQVLENTKIVFWDSSKGGSEPSLIGKELEIKDTKLFDKETIDLIFKNE